MTAPLPSLNLANFQKFHIDEHTFVVCENNARILHLNASAEIFFDLYCDGMSPPAICAAIADAAGQEISQIEQDFEQFLDDFIAKPYEPIDNTIFAELDSIGAKQPFTLAATRHYAIGGKLIVTQHCEHSALALCDDQFDAFIDPSHTSQAHAAKVSICQHESGFGLYLDNLLVSAAPDAQFLDAHLRNALVRAIAQPLKSWVCLHAAAVLSPANKTTLFIGSSGSGKSTLSTWLYSQGYQYLGDESVVLDLDTLSIIPLPSAANLKPGSWPLFPDLAPQLSTTYRESFRPVRYLKIPIEQKVRQQAFPVDQIVYLEFTPDQACNLTPLNTFDKLCYLGYNQPYFGKAYDATEVVNIAKSLCSIDTYSLEFGNFKEALSALEKISQ